MMFYIVKTSDFLMQEKNAYCKDFSSLEELMAFQRACDYPLVISEMTLPNLEKGNRLEILDDYRE